MSLVSRSARASRAAQTLAVMLVARAVYGAAAAVAAVSGHAPTAVNAGVAVGSVVMAGAVWRSRQRLWLHAGTLAVIAGVTVTVAVTRSTGAAALAISYSWVGVYAAFFFSRAVVRVYVATTAVALAAALLVNPFPAAVNVWVLTVPSVAVAAEVICGLVTRLEASASLDPLTGALNRRGLQLVTEQAVARAGSSEETTLAIVDLDGFKLVNDRAGHAAGDQLLVDLVTAWRATLRTNDVVARLGGDEFLVLLPGTTRHDAHAVIDRLREVSPISWSCGFATAQAGLPLDELLHEADADLYRAKRRLSVTRA